jgi:hypothetical protein
MFEHLNRLWKRIERGIMNGSTSSSSNALWICSSTSPGPSLVQQEAKAFHAWPGVRSSFPKRLAKYSITSSRVRWPVATNVSRPFIAADLTYSFACSFSISALMPLRSPPDTEARMLQRFSVTVSPTRSNAVSPGAEKIRTSRGEARVSRNRASRNMA